MLCSQPCTASSACRIGCKGGTVPDTPGSSKLLNHTHTGTHLPAYPSFAGTSPDAPGVAASVRWMNRWAARGCPGERCRAVLMPSSAGSTTVEPFTGRRCCQGPVQYTQGDLQQEQTPPRPYATKTGQGRQKHKASRAVSCQRQPAQLQPPPCKDSMQGSCAHAKKMKKMQDHVKRDVCKQHVHTSASHSHQCSH